MEATISVYLHLYNAFYADINNILPGKYPIVKSVVIIDPIPCVVLTG